MKSIVNNRNYDGVKFILIITTVLISINFWSFKSIKESIYNQLELAICLILLFIVVYNLWVLNLKLYFKTNVLLFIFIPLLGVVGAKLYHDQQVSLSLLAIRVCLFWLLYFVLHIFDISTKKIIQLIVFIGCVWITLTVLQQFTYPDYYFYTRSDDSKSIYRAGVYRYMILGQQYGLFVLFYFFLKYMQTKKAYALIYIAAALIGLYYYGTRQMAVAAVVTLFIGIFLLKGVDRWKYLLIVTVFVSILFGYYSFLFKDYIDMTNQQLDEDDYIRILSADFYLNQYWPHWGAKLLGNGAPHHASSYGEEISTIQSVLHYWRSDVGIIGAYNQFGIFFVLNIILTNLKGIFIKNLGNSTYLRLFFIYFFSLLILSQSFSSAAVIPFYCLIFYLVDKELNNGMDFLRHNKKIIQKELVA